MNRKWVSTWGQSHINMHVFTPRAKNRTMRLSVENNLNGEKIRLRISNAAGSRTVKIGKMAVKCGGIKKAITVDGNAEVILEPHVERYSDEVEITVRAGNKIELSIFFDGTSEPLSGNALAETIQYSEKGDFVDQDQMIEVAEQSMVSKKFNLMMPIKVISGIEVLTSSDAKSLVVFGDSITQQGNWTIPFTRELYKHSPGNIAVVNKGIGGNRLLTDGVGPFRMFGKAAVHRYARDVLDEAGVRGVIIALGSNDLGQSKDEHDPNWRTADDMVKGYKQLVTEAKKLGLTVFAATITPRGSCTVDYWSEEREIVRLEINEWIRKCGLFEDVFDFDKAVACDQDPVRLEFRYDSGDHLHPNRFGVEAMADIISFEKIDKMIWS